MHDVAAGVFDNPRWERQVFTTGLNWRVHPTFLVKGEYAHRTVGLATANKEDTVALGFGFIFGE